MNAKTIVALAACIGLAACTSAAQRQENRVRSQAQKILKRRPSIGDPGKVAATDIAFARAARDEGQWTAFTEYSAANAMLHGANGVIEARPWLAQQADPAEAVRWGPKAVWSSCDGTLAVSFGRFRDPEGMVGSYVTVWEWQPEDRVYRWTYDMGTQDNPQPPPPAPAAEPDEDTIVVQGLGMVESKIADCLETDAPRPRGQQPALADPYTSADGTLKWRYEHSGSAPATRRVVVDWMRDGTWQTALDFTAPAPLAE